MNVNETMKLPADCTLMTAEEMESINGGAAAETFVKVVIAVGGAAALLVVGCVAARDILSIFGGLDSAIDNSLDAGKSFIDGALSAGQGWLDTMMGR